MLKYGIRYFVRAKVENAVGFSAWSNSASCTLVKRPGVVRNLTFTAAGPLAFNVSWNTPNDLGAGPDQLYPLLSYHMIVQTTVGAPNATLQGSLEYAIAGDRKSFQVVNLVKGSSYFISLRARNDARSSPDEQDWGYGPWGVAVAQCIDGEIRPSVCGSSGGLVALELPTSPVGFLVKPSGSGILFLQWEASVDTGNGSMNYPLLRYEVQFSSTDDFAGAETVAVPGFLLQYSARTFAVGDSKVARVRAVNDAGPSKWSGASRGTALLLPDAPREVTLTNGNLSIQITWVDPEQTGLGKGRVWKLLSFQVSAKPVECLLDVTDIHVFLLNRRNTTLENITKGCVYSVRVRAENEAGWSNYSEPKNATALALATQPTNLTALSGAALQLVLKWDLPIDTGDGKIQNKDLILAYRVDIFNSSAFERPF